jgi:hypothetical protein
MPLGEDALVTTTANGERIELTPRGDGLYDGTFTATTNQSLSIVAEVRVGERAASMSVVGGVVRDYRYNNVPFDWIDVTEAGTRTGITTDDGHETIAIPFPFTFYDREYQELAISANGLVTFTPVGDAFDNAPIPNPGAPNGFIAPFWDDLNPETGGEIWYTTVGEAPNRRFVIEWFRVPHYHRVGAATFQLVLHEGSNAIDFQYDDLDFGHYFYTDGASATVGIEDPSGDVGKQLSFEDTLLGSYVRQAGLRFTPVVPGDPTIETLFLDTGFVGEPYLQTLTASGATPPYTWSIVGGALPDGLTLNEQAGEISGTPTDTGTFAFTVAVHDSGEPARTIAQEFSIHVVPGYAIEDGPFNWIDATDGGTNLGFTAREQSTGVDLPFLFTFYDEEFSRIQVGTNGLITLGTEDASTFKNANIPDQAPPNGYIAPFWDDLAPESGGGVWTRTVGTAPNRIFVIEWHEAPRYRDIDAITFEVLLHEGSNVIEFQYLDAYLDFSVYDYGDAATIGIENPAGTSGELFSFETESLQPYEGTKSLRFVPLFNGTPPPSITSIPPTTAVVGETYTYPITVYGQEPIDLLLVDAPEGMILDPATNTITWTPATVGAWNVSIQASNATGADTQSFELTVYAGHSVEATLPVIDGWESSTEQTLTELGELEKVAESDNEWLVVDANSWTSFAFAPDVPAGATIQQVRVVVEHHEDFNTPYEDIIWEVGGGPLDAPAIVDSTPVVIFTTFGNDKVHEWDVTTWFQTSESVNDLKLVVRNLTLDKRTSLDQVTVVVTYVPGG